MKAKKRHHKKSCSEWVILLLLAGGAASAGDKQMIETRIANYREIGTAFKQVNDELKLKQPDMERIRSAARLIKDRGSQMLQWFPAGSEPDAPVHKSWFESVLGWFGGGGDGVLPDEDRSYAKLEVWTQPAKFKAAHRNFMREAEKLSQTAQSGNIAAIGAQSRVLGEACKSCHQDFRTEKE